MDDILREAELNRAALMHRARENAKMSREALKMARYSPKEHAQGEKSYVSPEEAIRALGLLKNHQRLATELVYKMIEGKPAYEAAREASDAGIGRYNIREMIKRTQRIIDEARHLDRPVLSPRNNGYVKSLSPLDLIKAKEKAPPGFVDFGSKIPGGARKPNGHGGFDYWYPGKGVSSGPHDDEHSDHHDSHRQSLERQLEASKKRDQPSPEVHAKFMELKQKASDHGISVTGKHPHGGHTMEHMESFEKRLDRAIEKKQKAAEESADSGPASESTSPPTGEKADQGSDAGDDNRAADDEFAGLSPKQQVQRANENAKAYGDLIADMKKLGNDTSTLEAAHGKLTEILEKIGADSDDPVVKPSERETLKQLTRALRWMVFGMLTGFLAGGGAGGIGGLVAGSAKAMHDQKGIRQRHKDMLGRYNNHAKLGQASREMESALDAKAAEQQAEEEKKPTEDVETDEDVDPPVDPPTDEAPREAEATERPHFGDNGSEVHEEPQKNRAQRRSEAAAARKKPKSKATPDKAASKKRRKQQKASRRKNRAKKSLFIDMRTGLPVFASADDLAKAEGYRVPDGARGNARKVLAWKEKHGSDVKGMTPVGWARARQLSSQATIGLDTVKRMSAFNRHRKNAAVDPKHAGEPWKDRGYVAWLGWGGTTGIDWARRITGALEKGFTAEDVHDLADAAGVEWDDNQEFMDKCEKLVGKRHLDDMTEDELRIVADSLEKANDAVSAKIRLLMDEGKPQDQAVAIALDMERRGELSKAGPFIGPRGGKWKDPQHKIPWTGPMSPRPHAHHHGALNSDDIRALEAHIAERMGDRPPPGKKVEIPLTFDETGTHIVVVKASTNPRRAQASRSADGKGGYVEIDVLAGKPLAREKLRGLLAHEIAHAADPDLIGKNVDTAALHDAEHATHWAERKPLRAEAAIALEEPATIAHGLHLMEHGTPWGKKPLSKSEAATQMLDMIPTKRPVTQAGLLPEMHAYAMKLLGSKLSKAGPFIGPRGGKWADAKHTIPWKETSGKRGKKQEAAPEKKAPASQLPPQIQAKLRELGVGKLPAGDIPVEHIHLRLDGDHHETAVIKWRDAKGKLQSGYTPEFHKRNAAQKWERVMQFIDGFPKTKRSILKALSKASPGSREHQAALVSAIIAHSGLRPGSTASAKSGHYGVTTLTPNHVTIEGNKISIEYVGKGGKKNTATIRNKAIAEALSPYVKGGNKRNKPMFNANVTSDARKILPDGLKLKDMRTITATLEAMRVLDSVVTPPPLTGNKKKDKRLLAKALLSASKEVAKLINNTAAVARSSYVHPEVFRKWAIDRAGADASLFEEV